VPRGGIARRPWGPYQEFDLFVTQLVTEMTVKAGQKCAAIRRAFVPTAALDDVEEAVAAKLAEVTVGNPADPTVTMGALASLVQRDDVRGQVRKLAAGCTTGQLALSWLVAKVLCRFRAPAGRCTCVRTSRRAR
jgi:hypothetical protein